MILLLLFNVSGLICFGFSNKRKTWESGRLRDCSTENTNTRTIWSLWSLDFLPFSAAQIESTQLTRDHFVCHLTRSVETPTHAHMLGLVTYILWSSFTCYTQSNGATALKKSFCVTNILGIFTLLTHLYLTSSLPPYEPISISLASLLAELVHLCMFFIVLLV